MEHGLGSGVPRTLGELCRPGRMALVYHNITPPEYFLGVHKDLVKLCFRGRRELTAYIPRVELAHPSVGHHASHALRLFRLDDHHEVESVIDAALGEQGDVIDDNRVGVGRFCGVDALASERAD